jgi:hypothetical protein
VPARLRSGILNRVVGKEKLPALLQTANTVLDAGPTLQHLRFAPLCITSALTINAVANVCCAGRDSKLPVVYVRVAQRTGYVSVSKENKIFGGLIGSTNRARARFSVPASLCLALL